MERPMRNLRGTVTSSGEKLAVVASLCGGELRQG